MFVQFRDRKYVTLSIALHSVVSVLSDFESLSDNTKKDVLLYGEPSLDQNKNKFILEATLTFIKSSERFSRSLFE